MALMRGRRVRHARIGRPVQQSLAAGTHRQHPAGRSRGALLRHAERASHGRVTQTKQPSINPERFKRDRGSPPISYDNAYLFGAICPARGVGAALALPYADTDMMQLHLDEISSNVAKGAHAVLLLDRAGWHITSKLGMPDNITPIFLPSRAPELNPVENVRQYLRQNWISARSLGRPRKNASDGRRHRARWH